MACHTYLSGLALNVKGDHSRADYIWSSGSDTRPITTLPSSFDCSQTPYYAPYISTYPTLDTVTAAHVVEQRECPLTSLITTGQTVRRGEPAYLDRRVIGSSWIGQVEDSQLQSTSFFSRIIQSREDQ